MNKITSFNPIQWAKVSKAEQIRTVANLIVEMNIDITEGYNNWRNIAFGISLELGEEGRSIFHDISRFKMLAISTRSATSCIPTASSACMILPTTLVSPSPLSLNMPRRLA